MTWGQAASRFASVLLLACVVVVVLAMGELLARARAPRWSIAVSLACAVLAVTPALLGRPFASILVGLTLTALLASPLALLAVRRLLRAGAPGVDRDKAFWVALIAVVVLGAWVEIGARLWDGELGHYGFSSSIARGVLPPEHPLFPGEPLRYHAGFDVLVALVVTAGIPVGAAVHVASIALLALTCWVLHDAGRALTGAAMGWAVACVPAVALWGYGPTAVCLAGGWASTTPSFGFCSALFPSAWVSAQSMPPPVMSSFFQHPQGLAMPIALALMLLACERLSAPGGSARVLVTAAGLVLLSQCQIVFFACTGLAIGLVAVGAAVLQHKGRELLIRALALGAAGGLGLWASLIAGGAGELRFGRGYFTDGPVLLVLHHLAVFGPTIVALPLAAMRAVALGRAPARDGNHVRVALIIAAAAGFVVANLFTYARSWDIVKFFAVGSFFANVLLADWLIAVVQRGRVALAVALAALSISSASFWLVRHGPLNGVVAPRYGLGAPSALGQALLAKAGDRIGARDIVLTDRIEIWQLGFHVAGAGRAQAKGQLIDLARADDRQRIAKRALRSFARDDLAALSVDWVLTSKQLPADRFALEVDVLDQHLYRVLP